MSFPALLSINFTISYDLNSSSAVATVLIISGWTGFGEPVETPLHHK
jgi:hypothetical protein